MVGDRQGQQWEISLRSKAGSSKMEAKNNLTMSDHAWGSNKGTIGDEQQVC